MRAANSDLVTIVVTCFNHGSWLGDSIASVKAQTYPWIETIIVDDGSTDDTAAICRGFSGIRYIRQTNLGLSAARNTGLRAATGPFICFLDADDLLRPEAIANGVDALVANETWAFVYGGHLGVSADRTPIWEFRSDPEQADYRSLLRANVIGMHATVLYRQEILEREGGFDTSLRAAEDYDVFLRIARRHQIGCHDGVIAEYRQHNQNMSRDHALMLTATMAVLRSQAPHLIGSRDHRTALREGVRSHQARYGEPMVLRALRDLTDPGRRADALNRLNLAGRIAPGTLASAALKAARRGAREIERRLPTSLRRLLRSALGRLPLWPPPGQVRFGDLRRTSPLDRNFGFARGTPVDRSYIEHFLACNAETVAGSVLEVGDNGYTICFGGARVTRTDVLHISPDGPGATIIGDLAYADHILSESFDCIILTQTLHLIFDLPRAVATLHRILKPGGVLLLTVPGISQVDRGEWGHTWYWSLTDKAVRRLFAEGWSEISIETYGSVLTALSFLHGLAAEELTPEELAAHDPAYQVIVAARAVKALATV